MNPIIYSAPVPGGTAATAASPKAALEMLHRLFPSRFAATGLVLYTEDLEVLKPLTTTAVGDVNGALWRHLSREIEKHGAVRVWGHYTYKEEA